MVDKGILNELIDLCEILTKENNKDNLFDHDRGIRQAIGFRAFKEYLKLTIVDRVQPDKEIYLEAINMLKIHTKQYAKNQLKWIRNKLVPLCNDLNIKVIAINMSEKNDHLIPEILDLCKDFVEESLEKSNVCLSKDPDIEKILKKKKIPKFVKDTKTILCEECSRRSIRGKMVDPIILRGDDQWSKHINSKSHKKCIQYNRKTSLVLYKTND